MTIEVEIVTLPDYLASALINGDETGLEHGEDWETYQNVLKNFIPEGWEVVGVATDDKTGDYVEPRFTWSYRLYGGLADGGSVLDYVVVRHS